jgi:hypothetical protein
VDHGYITYTGRCFFDIARQNNYELVACWFDSSPYRYSNLLDGFKSFSNVFPILRQELEEEILDEYGKPVDEDILIPDIGINVVFRKVNNRPFLGAIEMSTSVGDIPSEIIDVYSSSYSNKLKVRVVNLLKKNPPLLALARNVYQLLVKGRQVR